MAMNEFEYAYKSMMKLSKKFHIDNASVGKQRDDDDYVFYVRSYDEDFLNSLPEEFEGYLVIGIQMYD